MSCDILPTEALGPHHQGDVRDVLNDGWDMMIAFPPCQYLTSSNAWRWNEIAAEREQALSFVRALLDAPIARIAVENPKGAIGTHIRPADQYIHPWQFGDAFQKQTGLWLKGLPKLAPVVAIRPDDVAPFVVSGSYYRRKNKNAGVGERASHKRSLTFAGIAVAMADQWGGSE